MQTYRELFAAMCVAMLSRAASALALGNITYDSTGSPVLTALSMFGGPLISLLASHFVLAGSDRHPPRLGMIAPALVLFVVDAVQAMPGLAWPLRFVLLAVPYAVNSMFAGSIWVVVSDIVPAESFVLARSMLNLAVGGMQVVGYGLGGVALLWFSTTDLFLVAAGASLVCALSIRFGIRDRPARGSGAGSMARRTREVNRRLLGSRVTRPLYVAMWVPNGLVVGCEALFVPYGRGAVAGMLFAAAAAGMMVGDLVVGRFVPVQRRDALIEPLRWLLAAPYLVVLFAPPVPVTVVVAFVASVGYSASLPLQERLIRNTDPDIQGQTMGLYTQGLAIGQALAALLAGSFATLLAPAHAIGVMACLSLAVTALNSPGLRRSATSAPSLTGP